MNHLTERDLETRFNILRSKYYMPGFIRITTNKHTQEIEIRNTLGILGTMCKVYKRNKVSQVVYHITEMGITESNI